MAYRNYEITTSKYIEEIREMLSRTDYHLMTEKITGFTKYLFTNTDLIYSTVNNNFQKSGVVNLLMDSFSKFNEQSKRDILRLLNIFLKTNNNLRNDVTRNVNFIEFLLRKLDSKEAWSSIEKFKYYINITSYIMLNKDVKEHFETESIRRIVRQVLEESKNEENYQKRILYMIFYASAEINSIIKTVDEFFGDEYENMMCKYIIGTFVEIIRDYLVDFRTFYTETDNEKNKLLKYALKVEYSFDQICQCIYYFAQYNEKLRQNIFQSGIYDLLSNIFLIHSVPESFILTALDVFSIPCLDISLKERFRKEHSNIIDKLKNLQFSQSLLIKNAAEKLLNSFDYNNNNNSNNNNNNSHTNNNSNISSINQSNYNNNNNNNNSNNNNSLSKDINHRSSQTDMLITLPQPCSKLEFLSSTMWGSLDVDHWLAENNLEECRKKLSPLTGKGLNQLKYMMNEPDGKFKLIELLMSKLDLDFLTILELFGALEHFKCE